LIVLQKNSTTSNIALTLQESVTLTNPTFLFEFKSDAENKSYYVISADLADAEDKHRYNLFDFTEGVSDPENGSVELGITGQYTYQVWEQESTTNLDPALAETLLETGIMKLQGVNETITENDIDQEYTVHEPTS
jgi:hypothetical protein